MIVWRAQTPKARRPRPQGNKQLASGKTVIPVWGPGLRTAIFRVLFAIHAGYLLRFSWAALGWNYIECARSAFVPLVHDLRWRHGRDT